MSKELEIKLLVDLNSLENVLSSPLLKRAKYAGEKVLWNTYFDTETCWMESKRMALRVRKTDAAFVQTLKTAGQVVDGVHQRNEWEVAVPSEQLDVTRFDQEALTVSGLTPALVADLRPVFTTDFKRSVWNVSLEGAEIEIVLDQGEIRCQVGEGEWVSEPLLECELELKSGSVDVLKQVADAWVQEVPALIYSDISKAQRGYALFRRACQLKR